MCLNEMTWKDILFINCKGPIVMQKKFMSILNLKLLPNMSAKNKNKNINMKMDWYVWVFVVKSDNIINKIFSNAIYMEK
jgi:hypothetical protein